MKPALVVLAAGMGSRYGGLKQVDPVGPSGEAILDYSVFDAIRGGFGRVIFVIRREFEAEFRAKVAAKYAGVIPVELCHQELSDLPPGFALPAGRVKPWGTAHAVLSARKLVDGPFAVINADDFYGRDAMARLGEFLSSPSPSASTLSLCMVGYRLSRTLSENGSVARGICEVDGQGCLKGVVEMTKLVRAGDHAENREDEAHPAVVPLDARVSMNCWGFSAALMAELERRFPAFLSARGSELKSEWYIPFVVDELIREGKAQCRVLPTESSWFGVTYREDKPSVMASIAQLVEQGEYPRQLF